MMCSLVSRSADSGPRRQCLAALIGIAGLAASMSASASCSVKSGFSAQDITMDMGRVVVQPDAAIGSVIAKQTATITRSQDYGTCTGTGGSATGAFVRSNTKVAGFDNVYSTNVAGIGIRLYREAGQVSTYYPHVLTFGGSTTVSLSAGYFQVELIKTAAQTGAGAIADSGLFSTYYLDGSGITRPILTSTIKGNGITVVSSTCQVKSASKNIVVDFGSVANTSFNGAGSRSTSKDFAIGLTCQGGNGAGSERGLISVRLDGTQDPSNRQGVLKIDSGSNAATGLGIELVSMLGGSEAALTLGSGVQVGSTSTNASTDLTLPLRARYIQTGSARPTAGTANGSATFTIEYK